MYTLKIDYLPYNTHIYTHSVTHLTTHIHFVYCAKALNAIITSEPAKTEKLFKLTKINLKIEN